MYNWRQKTRWEKNLTGHDERGILVLCLEVGEDLGIVAGVVAQPIVIVHAYVPEELHLARNLLGDGRGWSGCSHGCPGGERET
jgi:hypothetical protein